MDLLYFFFLWSFCVTTLLFVVCICVGHTVLSVSCSLVVTCWEIAMCLLCLFTRLFICALWSPAGKGLASWLSFVVSYCEFVTFP